MKESLELGPTPCEEDCAQVGQDNFEEQSIVECRAYVNQLQRILKAQFGVDYSDAIARDTLSLSTKRFAHDFGFYREVVVKFDDKDESSINMAFWIENNLPGTWDNTARVELNLPVSYSALLPIV